MIGFSCLDLKNLFSKFDVNSLARLAEIYDGDFSDGDRATMRDQLETYVLHVMRHMLALRVVQILQVCLSRL